MSRIAFVPGWLTVVGLLCLVPGVSLGESGTEVRIGSEEPVQQTMLSQPLMMLPAETDSSDALAPALEPPTLTAPKLAMPDNSKDSKTGKSDETSASKSPSQAPAGQPKKGSKGSDVGSKSPSENRRTPTGQPAKDTKGSGIGSRISDQHPVPARLLENLTTPDRTIPPSSHGAAEKAAEPAVLPQAKVRRELTPELEGLRDRIRRTLAVYWRQTLNTRDYTAGDLISACLPFGCLTEVQSGQDRINGITCLCWNYPCGGFDLLTVSDGHVAVQIGYGRQICPGQFLAMLALARVPADYPVRSGKLVRTVADLVEFEKLDCQEGIDQSLRLVGLAHYISWKATWKNRNGEPWSLDQMVDFELARPSAQGPSGGTYRLLALACAVLEHSTVRDTVTDPIRRAQKFLREYHQYAFKTQNADGSWHPSYFAAMGSSNDQAGQLVSTGHIARWLAVSLPDSQLDQPQMLRAMEYLVATLGWQQARWNPASLSARGLEGLMTGLHCLSVYDERVFKPLDPKPEQQPDADKTPAKAGAKG